MVLLLIRQRATAAQVAVAQAEMVAVVHQQVVLLHLVKVMLAVQDLGTHLAAVAVHLLLVVMPQLIQTALMQIQVVQVA
jgi:hypothetical protein